MDMRVERYAGFSNSQDEICMSNTTDQCLLDNTNPSNAIAYANTSCNQGSVSKHYIAVSSAADVQAAFAFSRQTGIKLSVKATGHDYHSRSSIKGTLALWMRGLQNMTHEQQFIPQGCSAKETVDAITFGAGVIAGQAYEFADAKNVTILGPYAPTIAISGGWLQGGGHTVLSPVYGLGVDRVVEFKIVTPDGQFRIANKCQNPDLFWALRGGGGGTFGVVLEATHKVESRPIPMAVATMSFPTATDKSNIMPFLDVCVNESLRWGQEGWGGHIQFQTTKLIHVNPLLSLEEAQKSMQPVTDFVESQNGTAVIEMLPSWYAFFKKYLISNTAVVGSTRIVATRLIPTSLFSTQAGKSNLSSFLSDVVDAGYLPYIPVTTPFLVDSPSNTTSAHPAWRSSLWTMGYGSLTLPWNSTLEQTRAALSKTAGLVERAEKLAPESGTYFNEAFPWTGEWQKEFWAGNYERLLGVKRRYDPEGLLSCWKCVGFDEGQRRSAFRCFGDLLA